MATILAFAPALFLAVGPRIEVVDEVYRIPPNEWRYVEVSLKQQAALVSARFSTTPESPPVRVALLRHDDLEKLRDGEPHGLVDITPESPAGLLRYAVPEPGDYALVIDNPAGRPASVHLTIWLDFSRGGPAVTQLSPRRQLTVVAVSFAVFFGIVAFSARRLLGAMRKHRPPPVS